MITQYDIVTKIAEKIAELDLEEQPQVVPGKRFSEDEALTDGVHLYRSEPKFEPGTMGADDTDYPVVVLMVVGQSGGIRENEEMISDWREKIINAFHYQRPLQELNDDDSTYQISRTEQGSDFLGELWQKRWDANHKVIWNLVRRWR